MLTAADHLQKNGHNVVVAGKGKAILLERAKAMGIPTEVFNIHGDFAPFKVEKIKRFFQQHETDVCILNLNKDVRVAGLAARKAGVPVILARHGLKLIRNSWKYKMTMDLVDGIITNSHSIKEIYDSFHWMPRGKTEVIYNGLNIPDNVSEIDLHGQYHIPKDHLIFGAAGRLAYQKGFDLLIKAAEQLKDRPFTFLIAGQGKLKQYLENLINQYNLQDSVKLIGFLENALPFLNSVDIVVQPSRYEGMPNTVLEAMALGKPVLAAEVNGVRELIQNGINGFSIPPESVHDLVRGILQVADCKNIRDIQQRGIETINSNYSTEKMIIHLENYFGKKYNESMEKLCKGISRQSKTLSTENTTSLI